MSQGHVRAPAVSSELTGAELGDERLSKRLCVLADQLAHLFEPFNRLGIENEGIEGTGIGLTIVKALVESMGGTIAVSSKYRQGTVFEVALPVPCCMLDMK